jgi:tetratricopeptide (TPR) repeat protein
MALSSGSPAPGLLAAVLAFAVSGFAAIPDLERARQLYERAEFEVALEVLQSIAPKDGAVFLLIGQCYYMGGNPKAASRYFEKAVASDPRNPRFLDWLGRACSRRAESANIFTAPRMALKARHSFEAAVRLDPHDEEAVGDLFEYYLNAPAILGGGIEKAAELVQRVRFGDRAEHHYRLARVAEKRKQFAAAEQHYRRAAELAPADPGRLIDLAKFCEARGRQRDTDEIFRRARETAPLAPGVWFGQAETYINSHRNIETARTLLLRYLAARLTPRDPPRHEARKLLQRIPES